MISLLAAVMPIMAKLLFLFMEKKGIDAENKRKFLEAVQSIDGLRSTNLKKEYDKVRATMSDEVDAYNAKTKL